MASSSQQTTIIFIFFVVLACVSSYFSFLEQPLTLVPQESTRPISLEQKIPPPITAFTGNKKAGFTSLTKETLRLVLPRQGTLPSWLKGDFLGTGPAQFELGSSKVKYWFNGFAMLHAFHVNQGSVEYHNKFLESEYYKRCTKKGKFDSNMSTEKPKSFFSRLASTLTTPDPYDNGTIALTKLYNTYFALTETTLPVAFDPKTLQTTELFHFEDALEGHLTTAQFQYDPEINAWYNYMIEFGTTSNYHFYKINNGERIRTLITSLPVKNPAYMRSFGMTKNYLILVEIPFVVNPLDLLLAAGAFIENVAWKPALGTNLIVINKHTGTLVGSYKTDAVFMFNTINAFEDSKKITLDLIAHKDPSLIACTSLEALRNATYNQEFPSSYIHRIEINLEKNQTTQKQLAKHSLEFPTINKLYAMKRYSFIYGLGAQQKDAFPHHIIKVDIKTGEHCIWSENGCYASAPVFVPRPKGKQEDDGVIISVVFDSTTEHSFLLVLDAQNLIELARFALPHHIPLGLMSQFYPTD